MARALRLGIAIVLVPIAVPVFAKPPGGEWVLRGDGLARHVAGRVHVLRFGASSRMAITTVAASLGPPLESHTAPDCGNGHPMVLTTFRGGLTLQSWKGRFSGWSLDPPADRRLTTAGAVTIGSRRAAVLAAYPKSQIDDTALGVMFTNDREPSGFLDGRSSRARVTALFAGETCMIF